MFVLNEDQVAVRDMAREFAAEKIAPHALRWDEEKHFPVEVMREAAKLGMGGIYIRDDVGGSAMTRFDAALIFEALATGCPTVALYGPTDPRLWGPWPAHGLPTPWAAAGTIQQRRNVWLVQNPLPCLPCQNEGCEKRVDSHSRCLDELTPRQVLAAVDQALNA